MHILGALLAIGFVWLIARLLRRLPLVVRDALGIAGRFLMVLICVGAFMMFTEAPAEPGAAFFAVRMLAASLALVTGAWYAMEFAWRAALMGQLLGEWYRQRVRERRDRFYSTADQ